MAEGYGQIYVVNESDKIFALDKETGEISWESESFLRRELTAPVAYSNYLVVGDGGLFALPCSKRRSHDR